MINRKSNVPLYIQLAELIRQQIRNGEIKVGISQRHIHLSREHLDILFGKGYFSYRCSLSFLDKPIRKHYSLSYEEKVQHSRNI